FEEVVERLVGEDLNRRAGRQPQLVPMAQPIGIVILRFADYYLLPASKFREPAQIAMPEFARRRWNGVAMRGFARLAEIVCQRLLQSWRNGVLERLGLRVHFTPIQAEHTCQKGFNQAVSADNTARLRQPASTELGPTA